MPVICLFSRDLRLHDNPMLDLAREQDDTVVPLFVLDDQLLQAAPPAPNRVHFLIDALQDLRAGLKALGADLVVRRGDPATTVAGLAQQLGADRVLAAEDVTPRARRRTADLRTALEAGGLTLTTTPGVTIVPPDEVLTGTGTPFQVFTPYWRAWQEAPRRSPGPPPEPFRLPEGLEPGAIPEAHELVTDPPSVDRWRGGETAARARLHAWLDGDLADYEVGHDDPAGDRTSHLSADLHFGTLSPLEVAAACDGRPGGAAFIRQLCWRDFHHQVLHHRPEAAWTDWRERPWPTRHDDDEVAAWKAGLTGIPIVDAGMRQLHETGWMHNRLRMIVASVLTKHLLVPWQVGARHFLAWLVDGDVANNALNWQWVAGRGADTRPNRLFNPIRQAHKLDPSGEFVRRYVPELASVAGRQVHEPWALGPLERHGLDYPEPIVDLAVTGERFRQVVEDGRARS